MILNPEEYFRKQTPPARPRSETNFDLNAWKSHSLPADGSTVELFDGTFGWYSGQLIEENRTVTVVDCSAYGDTWEYYSTNFNKCYSRRTYECFYRQLGVPCINCDSVAVPLWDGTFGLAKNCKIHYSGKFFLLSENAIDLNKGGYAHEDEVVMLTDGTHGLKPDHTPMEGNIQNLENKPEQKDDTPIIEIEDHTREAFHAEFREALENNLNASKKAALRCTLERDSSLAEYAHLFAQRLEVQVISVIKDGLEALSIYEEAGDDLDEATKKRLLDYIHRALRFKGLGDSP